MFNAQCNSALCNWADANLIAFQALVAVVSCIAAIKFRKSVLFYLAPFWLPGLLLILSAIMINGYGDGKLEMFALSVLIWLTNLGVVVAAALVELCIVLLKKFKARRQLGPLQDNAPDAPTKTDTPKKDP